MSAAATSANGSPASATVDAPDRIERSIVVRAPRDRVFQALADAPSFGSWFGVDLSGHRFAPGGRTRARFTKSGCESLWFDVRVDCIEPTTHFSFRWHPGAVDPGHDYAQEDCTLVSFSLADTPGGGTTITVVESGFDRVPPQRRFEAFRLNDRGWAYQMERIAVYVDRDVDG